MKEDAAVVIDWTIMCPANACVRRIYVSGKCSAPVGGISPAKVWSELSGAALEFTWEN